MATPPGKLDPTKNAPTPSDAGTSPKRETPPQPPTKEEADAEYDAALAAYETARARFIAAKDAQRLAYANEVRDIESALDPTAPKRWA